MREFEVRIGEKEYLPDGTLVEASVVNPLPQANAYTNTSMHEALHAGKSPSIVESVSIVPGPGYLGITKFSSFDSAAAAAPHAHGMDGTGWDEMLIEARGQSVGAADAEAKSKLARKGKHIEVLARYLQARKTISGNEVRQVMDRVDRGEEVEITVTTPTGGSETRIEKGVREEVVIFDLKDINSNELKKAA